RSWTSPVSFFLITELVVMSSLVISSSRAIRIRRSAFNFIVISFILPVSPFQFLLILPVYRYLPGFSPVCRYIFLFSEEVQQSLFPVPLQTAIFFQYPGPPVGQIPDSLKE